MADFLGGITGRVLLSREPLLSRVFLTTCTKQQLYGFKPNTTLSTVTYSCNKGFDLIKGPSQAVCQISGEWMPSHLPYCQRVLCGRPANIDKGVIYVDTYMYGDVVSYHCDTNYTLLGPRIRQCQASGLWSGYSPICKKTSCGLREILHARIVGDFSDKDIVLPGTSVQYICVPGYEMIGRNNVTCKTNGRWTSYPECHPIRCLVHGVIADGYIKLLQRTCMTSGRWGGVEPRCEPVSCGEPPEVEYATKRGSKFTFGQSCVEGYQMRKSDRGIMLCQSDGEWRGLWPTCDKINCGSLPGIAHGISTATGYSFEDTVSYECDEGYKLHGTAMQTCHANGSWSGEQPQCQRIVCVEPPIVQHANITGELYYTRKILYTCESGFEIVGDRALKCEADRTWSGQVPRCEPVSCGFPPNISQSRIIGTDFTFNANVPVTQSYALHLPSIPKNNIIGTDFTFNKTVSFSCGYGYYPIEDVVLRCSENGEWIGNAPECKPVVCEAPPVVDFAILMINSLTFASNVTYRCIPGFNLIGSSILYCSVNGSWSNASPICEPVTCGAPPVYPNSNTTGLEYTYNNTVFYQCDYGYDFNSGENTVMKCIENGTWIGDIPQCTPVSCGSPDTVDHGYVIGDTHTYGSIVQFKCNLGYDMYGSNTATCSGDASWWFESSQPYCIPIQCGPPPTVLHATLKLN
ncbi:sushi, von Willebrand factor type A, EGF and pentraxin domain-containing protein 1-like [Amphiura filiformis]|uniref:sushi, von Willebrand factor type A, EGF and pentraxin domain-containing protein 1-like n=1 Tax=Amphiura filiformis TaxID=82378 RepID=UPI003B2122BC